MCVLSGCVSITGFHGRKWYAGETCDREDLWDSTIAAIRMYSGEGPFEQAQDLYKVNPSGGYLETYYVVQPQERMGTYQYARKFRAQLERAGAGWQVTIFVGRYTRKTGPNLDPEEDWNYLRREDDIEEGVIANIKASITDKYGTRMGTRKPIKRRY